MSDIVAAISGWNKIEIESVEAFGVTVYVRSISAWQKDRITTHYIKKGLEGFRGFICAMCICDEAGKPLYTEKQGPELGKHPATELEKIFDAACKLNGLGDFDNEAVEDEKKDSETEVMS